MRRLLLITLVLTAAWSLSACREIVAYDLSQRQAIETVSQLQLANINAKHLPNDDSSWNVQVPRADRVHATALILDLNLVPSPSSDESGTRPATFDPSAALRRHELERSRLIEANLRNVPGIRSASITLSLCESSSRSANACNTPNRLSALVLLNPNAEPPDEDALKEWLAASAPALLPENVELVLAWAPSVASHPTQLPDANAAPKIPPLQVAALGTLVGLLVLTMIAHLARRKIRAGEASAHQAELVAGGAA